MISTTTAGYIAGGMVQLFLIPLVVIVIVTLIFSIWKR